VKEQEEKSQIQRRRRQETSDPEDNGGGGGDGCNIRESCKKHFTSSVACRSESPQTLATMKTIDPERGGRRRNRKRRESKRREQIENQRGRRRTSGASDLDPSLPTSLEPMELAVREGESTEEGGGGAWAHRMLPPSPPTPLARRACMSQR
jgi:hypothetical protein